MNLELLTIFPGIFESFLNESLIKRARREGILSVTTSNIRDFAEPPHYQVDDSPYGGGAGMVMRPEPLVRAVEAARLRNSQAPVVLLTPAGERFTQSKAQELASLPGLILVCGRYEGIDERVSELVVDYEISIGDFVLMGGEVAAMAIMEAVVRLLPGVLGNTDSIVEESFQKEEAGTPLLEAPHYTRPPEYRGKHVPEVLLSGDHARIAKWREEESLRRTRARRSES